MTRHIFVIAALIVGVSFVTFAQHVSEPQNRPEVWTKPYEPFRIIGNVYYVGTYDLACYLITTSKGNILINTGLASSAQMIKSNVVALGFNFSDTKILLTTQAHYDHMGAMASIKKMTKAQMMVDEKDAGVLVDGGASDYALGGNGSTFAPVKADRLLRDRDVVELGDMKIVMLHHPGHTKGSCSFLFDVKDEKRIYKVLIANFPTIVTENNLSEIPTYPDIAKDYAYTLDAMRTLQFDIWLSSHASQFDLHSKHKPGDAYHPAAFQDRKGYDATLNSLQAEFTKRLERK
ncbi:MAG: subclass B3 metallo-beta-lactamase [Chryseolinea sp.]